MKIEYICEFSVLADLCNYMEAADQLFISQSALSRHIKTLEEELGVPLFDRNTRKVALSSFGYLFLPYAKRIVATRYEYETALANALNTEHDNIRIGAIPMMAQYHITDVIVRFRRENPRFSVDIVEADTNELVKLLRSGQCSMAFLREGETDDDEFNKIHYDTDVLAAFVSRSHPFARQEYIQIEHLCNEPLMLLGKETFMHSLCVNACKKAGFEPNVVLTCRRASNMLDLVRQNMGVALLTKRPTLPMIGDDVAVVDIEPRIPTHINLAYPKNQPLSIGSQHFIRLLKAMS